MLPDSGGLQAAASALSYRRATARVAMCVTCATVAVTLLSAQALPRGGNGGSEVLQDQPSEADPEALQPLGGCPRCHPGKLSRAVARLLRQGGIGRLERTTCLCVCPMHACI